MSRSNEIEQAYHALGKDMNNFYDGMMTGSTVTGRMVCRVVWNFGRNELDRYLNLALSGIPDDFSGRLLEVPVGTGVLTMPVYQHLPKADITCLDYSADMMACAQKRAEKMDIRNVQFCQGDVGNLPFADESFDLVLSLNGFHAFPDKDAAFAETFRVLKPGGIFCGCFFIQQENRRSDWFMNHVYIPLGFFTPPFETLESLRARLLRMYRSVQLDTVESMVCMVCRKEENNSGRPKEHPRNNQWERPENNQ